MDLIECKKFMNQLEQTNNFNILIKNKKIVLYFKDFLMGNYEIQTYKELKNFLKNNYYNYETFINGYFKIINNKLIELNNDSLIKAITFEIIKK